MRNYEDILISTIIGLLRDLRKSQGLTLEGLADQANVHRTTIGLIEREERSPSIALATQLARALGIPLSAIIKQAEEVVDRQQDKYFSPIHELEKREAKREDFYNEKVLHDLSGLSHSMIQAAIHNCYRTLDIIDTQLIAQGVSPIVELVELANLSSMIGNLLGSGIAHASEGLYIRNKPHQYPDLLLVQEPTKGIEIKMALEQNNPKGHLIKPGLYLIFRYVLAQKDGSYAKGKMNRGTTAWIWESRIGILSDEDFKFSNTQGDSGKTATIKTSALHDKMTKIYHVDHLDPFHKPRAFLRDR